MEYLNQLEEKYLADDGPFQDELRAEDIFIRIERVQYTSDDFRKVLNTNEFIQSMSRKGKL
ncbi:hypothetical protein L9Z41_18370, partial [Leptospira noguchii]|uniref:hypothetical protein n=1 Tax=Leptospira noguchii TaxID=28182 RepID=UPI001F05D40F